MKLTPYYSPSLSYQHLHSPHYSSSLSYQHLHSSYYSPSLSYQHLHSPHYCTSLCISLSFQHLHPPHYSQISQVDLTLIGCWTLLMPTPTDLLSHSRMHFHKQWSITSSIVNTWNIIHHAHPEADHAHSLNACSMKFVLDPWFSHFSVSGCIIIYRKEWFSACGKLSFSVLLLQLYKLKIIWHGCLSILESSGYPRRLHNKCHLNKRSIIVCLRICNISFSINHNWHPKVLKSYIQTFTSASQLIAEYIIMTLQMIQNLLTGTIWDVYAWLHTTAAHSFFIG